MLEWLQYFCVHDLDKLKTIEKLTQTSGDGDFGRESSHDIDAENTACIGVHVQDYIEFILQSLTTPGRPRLSCGSIFTTCCGLSSDYVA